MSFTIIPVEDYAWLSDVHKVHTEGAAVIILYGTEDAPDKVEVYALDHFEAKPVRTYFPCEYPTFEVIVSNVGSVHRSTNRMAAEISYNYHVELSQRGMGRCGGESVTLFCGDEIGWEHAGTVDLSE